MYRFLFPLFFLCFAGPLWACSCGGTLTYAPIVALPPSNTAFVRTVETIETGETVVPERAEMRTADKPAIPRSRFPDSVAGEPVKTVARKPQLTLRSLQIFDLPPTILAEQAKEPPESESETQTVNKPPTSTPVDDSNEGTKQEEISTPDINSDKEDEGEGEETEDTTKFMGQGPSQRGERDLQTKPGSPEGPSNASIPNTLTEESSEKDKENAGSPPKNRDQEDQDQESSALPGNVPGGPGSMDSQSWTITALVLLSAISTVAFLCTVFVVGEYRKRWLNAIMSQNGIVPSFQGGLYDIPTLSIGYRRYED